MGRRKYVEWHVQIDGSSVELRCLLEKKQIRSSTFSKHSRKEAEGVGLPPETQ
jgi:hypothetical protein